MSRPAGDVEYTDSRTVRQYLKGHTDLTEEELDRAFERDDVKELVDRGIRHRSFVYWPAEEIAAIMGWEKRWHSELDESNPNEVDPED